MIKPKYIFIYNNKNNKTNFLFFIIFFYDDFYHLDKTYYTTQDNFQTSTNLKILILTLGGPRKLYKQFLIIFWILMDVLLCNKKKFEYNKEPKTSYRIDFKKRHQTGAWLREQKRKVYIYRQASSSSKLREIESR